MSSLRNALRLYAVTDRHAIGERDFLTAVQAALDNGATMLQLREKELSGTEFSREAEKVQRLCQRRHVPLIINDDPMIAVDCGAVGVHIGQCDEDAAQVRAFLGPDKIMGISARTVAEAVAAEAAGADYLGVGAIFPTATKSDAEIVSQAELDAIVKAVKIPVVVIGGIHAGNLESFANRNIAGAAIVSAIFSADDIGKAVRDLDALTKKVFAGESK